MIYRKQIPEIGSTLIEGMAYNTETKELTINFRSYFVKTLIYLNVPVDQFKEFWLAESFGKFYLSNIKPIYNFKNYQEMSETKNRPKKINKAKKEKRFLRLSINLDKVEKKWIHVGEHGKYLNITLMLMPDGEVDQYGNLGMIVQDVPKEIAKGDKTMRGEILGNGAEYDWNTVEKEGSPGVESGALLGENAEAEDDLPF